MFSLGTKRVRHNKVFTKIGSTSGTTFIQDIHMIQGHSSLGGTIKGPEKIWGC